MVQKRQNTFGIIFLVIVAGMIILMAFFVFPGKKKDKNNGNDINTASVEILNQDTGKISNNMKKMVDEESIKIQVKEDINVDMSKLFEDKEKAGSNNNIGESDKNEIKKEEIKEKSQDLKSPKTKQEKSKTTNDHKPPTIKKNADIRPMEKRVLIQTPVKSQARYRNNFNDSQDQTVQVNEETHTSSDVMVVIHNQQKVKNGSTVKMRAIQEFIIDGVKIPRNTFISGIVSMGSQRVNIRVPSIGYTGKLYPVNFVAYDYGDGLEGVDVPDLILHDAVKEEANNALGQVKINTPFVSVPITTGRKAIDENTAVLTENYKLILRATK
ncbi:MAG: conjugative transposon protein TraM [Bacteroidota bacterium]|nr:conjugative transposon protein TraM [Bacteroidota bacterium]MDP4272649.1 conjugative transposon protein TraM [Bacteroidota bacterium]